MHTRFQILKMLFSLSVSGLLSLSATFLTSCRGDEVIYPTIGTHVTNEVQEGGLYVQRYSAVRRTAVYGH